MIKLRPRYNFKPDCSKPDVSEDIHQIKPVIHVSKPSTRQVDVTKLETLEKKFMDLYQSYTKTQDQNMFVSNQMYNAKIMVIGEALGETEIIKGTPFIGRSGQLMRQMFHAINLTDDKIYITNVMPWRPPNNRTPTSQEILMLAPYLKEHIDIINPQLLILVGSIAYRTLFNTQDPISSARGKWLTYAAIPTMIIFHPSYLLRAPQQKSKTWQDMIMIKRKVMELELC